MRNNIYYMMTGYALAIIATALIVHSIDVKNMPAPEHQQQQQPVISKNTILNKFHTMWYYDKGTWAKNTWFGVPTEQNPNDVWVIQEIISQVKPDFIIETGTFKGGSALLWATILQQVNPQGKVLTVDIKPLNSEASSYPVFKNMVEFIQGSSTDPEVIDAITKRVNGKKVMVILDSDHHANNVLDELNAYASLVPLGSYIVVESTNVNGHPVLHEFGPGPLEAVRKFLSTNQNFVSDRSRERLMFTLHPEGYLLRIK